MQPQLNYPSSFLPDLNPLECALLRHAPWAAALREKEAMLERVGLDELLSKAREAKLQYRKGTEPWVLLPDTRVITMPGEMCVAFEVLTDWWADHPFASGDVAFVCEGAETDNSFALVPSPLNFAFPTLEDFRDSLHEAGLPTQFVDASGRPIYTLFGVDDTNDGFPFQDRDFPPCDVRPDFGQEVEALIGDPDRIIATVRYMARRASRQ